MEAAVERRKGEAKRMEELRCRVDGVLQELEKSDGAVAGSGGIGEVKRGDVEMGEDMARIEDVRAVDEHDPERERLDKMWSALEEIEVD
jgi:hypothetical protein